MAVSLLTRVLGPPSTLAQWLAADSSSESLEAAQVAQVALRSAGAVPPAQLNTQPPVTLGVPAEAPRTVASGGQSRTGVVLDAQGKAAPVTITAPVLLRAEPVAADGVHVGAVLATRCVRLAAALHAWLFMSYWTAHGLPLTFLSAVPPPLPSAPACLLQPQWLSTAGQHVRLSPHKLSSGGGGGGGGGLSRSTSQSDLGLAAPELGSTPPQGQNMGTGVGAAAARHEAEIAAKPPPALLTLSPWRHSGSPAFLVDPGQLTEAHVPLAAAIARLEVAPMQMRAPAPSPAHDVQYWGGVAAVPEQQAVAPPHMPTAEAKAHVVVAALPVPGGGPSSLHPGAQDDSAHGASSWRSASASLSSPASAHEVHMLTPQRTPGGKGAAIHGLSSGLSESQLYGAFEDDLWDPMQAAFEDDLLGKQPGEAPAAALAAPEQMVVKYEPRVVRRRTSYVADDLDGEGGWIHREEGSGEWVEGQVGDGTMHTANARRMSYADADYAVW
jgi:hypothetical protein